MTTRVAPWFHAGAAGWESARARLPRPLTAEEAVTDLRWWERQVRLGRDDPETGRPLQRMPGRGRLVTEWGWDQPDRVHTPNAVRLLLADVLAWHPPPNGGTPHCAECAAAARKYQPSTSQVPAGSRYNADNGPESTSGVPAEYQPDDGASGAPAECQPSASQDTLQPALSAGQCQPSTSGVPARSRKGAGSPDYSGTENARSREATTAPPQPPQGGHPVDRLLESQAVTAGQRQLLLVLRRWTDPGAAPPHRWVVDWSEVLAWWARNVVARPDYAQLDLGYQLERWDAYLERAAALHRQGGGGKARFPKVWKNALHTWLGNAARYAAQAPTPPRRGSAPPSTGQDHADQPRRATTRRRGQPEGDSPGLFNLQPTDAGAGHD